ncbi:MAG TPA: hypothetical protein PLI43_19415 [Albidovulum sp.]|uniref:hypothetical protein n=1 Tax=Albidovulum sp. TaxID=1872424 RepID=UPI002B5A882B|nr:hypothetical protein [Albidovulum sp.]
MKLTARIFSTPFRALSPKATAARRLFADGRALDPETAEMVSCLPRHLLEDIGVTVREGPGNRMDKHLDA